MSEYRVVWEQPALKELSALSKKEAQRIQKKVSEHLAKSPQTLGKLLTGQWGGLYSYRVGDYRVIYELHQQDIVIVIVRVGHRKDVYES